jgi:hypothetical protein
MEKKGGFGTIQMRHDDYLLPIRVPFCCHKVVGGGTVKKKRKRKLKEGKVRDIP